MYAPERLERQLRQFSHYLRDPANAVSPTNIEERRLTVYRDLFFNNIENLLAGNFPVIKELLGHEQWNVLVRDFFREHHSQTPLFPEIGREFIQYLENRQSQPNHDPMWLLELAHYEWVELALDIAEQDNADDDISHQPGLYLNPLAWPLAYQWPVHRISQDYQPDILPDTPTFLLVLRDAEYKIRFIEISALSFRLLEYLAEDDGKTSDDYLNRLANEAQADDMDMFMHHGKQMLDDLIACGAIVSR